MKSEPEFKVRREYEEQAIWPELDPRNVLSPETFHVAAVEDASLEERVAVFQRVDLSDGRSVILKWNASDFIALAKRVETFVDSCPAIPKPNVPTIGHA